MMRRSAFVVLSLVVVSPSVLRAASLVGGESIYFGHLHNHTAFSDGSGTPEQACSTAKSNGLDFFGLSDHSDALTADEFTTMQSAANAADEPGVFSAFWGFEWSHGNYGHITVVNPTAFVTTGNSTTDTFSEFMAWLDSNAVVAFFNHPGRQDGSTSQPEFEHFTGAYSNCIVGMELWNKTVGFSGYYYNSGYTSDSRDRSGYYDEALLNGWSIGAAGSEDHHGSNWGGGSYRLAVLSGSNTRGAILDALRSRRFYSTLDRNLELSFQIDGGGMGSSVPGGWNQCVVRAADRDDESFSKVEIIQNGHIVHTAAVSGTLPVVTCDLFTQKGDYIYCKVTQSDGDEAISSPVFIMSDGPDGPPRADLVAPLDNGSADLEPIDNYVTVNTAQSVFQIQLVDFEGIDDATVTSDTVSIANRTPNQDYTFTYDSGTDIVTLAPVASGAFGNGTYAITLSGISDLAAPANTMTATIFTIRIDTSIVLPTEISFQNGIDTMIREAGPGTSYSGSSTLTVDTDDNGTGLASQVLLRFNNLVGSGSDQIPPYATIDSAILRLWSLDMGNGGTLYPMLQDWSDTATWNSLLGGDGIQANDVEASSLSDDSVGSNSSGYVELSVTGTVQDWADGAFSNYGWVILPNGSDGWDIASAEYSMVDYRPKLIVTYVLTGGRPPVADAGRDQTVVDWDGNNEEWIALDGSGSYHPELGAWIASYAWTVDGVSTYVGERVDVPLAVGVHTVILKVTDNAGLTDTDVMTITVEVPSFFRDDFESGGFTLGGWTSSTQVSVETTAAHSGTYGALLKKAASMETTVGTVGATNVTLSFWARVNGLQNEKEYLYVDWFESGVGAWQRLLSLTGTQGWAAFTYELSSIAGTEISLRFYTNGNTGNDLAMIDDIAVAGAASSSANPPTAVADSGTTAEDTPVTIDVLANDSDADGGTLVIASVAQPVNGTAVTSGGSVIYTPNADFNGSDSFTYVVANGQGGSATGTVSVTVTAVNDAPVVLADSVVTSPNTSVTIVVLANDFDVDGDSLSVVDVTSPSHGMVAISGNTVVYTPAEDFTGADTFTYTISDGYLQATATVSVNVSFVIATTVLVGDISMESKTAGPNRSALAVVTILDQNNKPLAGAVVYGEWSLPGGSFTSVISQAATADGKVTLTSLKVKSAGTFTFRVTDVVLAGYDYEPTQNVESADSVVVP